MYPTLNQGSNEGELPAASDYINSEIHEEDQRADTEENLPQGYLLHDSSSKREAPEKNPPFVATSFALQHSNRGRTRTLNQLAEVKTGASE